MTLDDFAEFDKVIVGLAELHGKELSAAAIKLYFTALRHWSLDDVKRAAVQLLRTSKFMPKPQDFEELRRANDDSAHEAWERVLRGDRLEPGSLEERAAQMLGGQSAIRRADIYRDLPHFHRRFLEAYADLSDRTFTREVIPQLANARSRNNALQGPVSLGQIPIGIPKEPA